MPKRAANQSLIRSIRPRPDFADRHLGGNGCRRIDAHGKRLYTVEAWDDFYRSLKPAGAVSVALVRPPFTVARSIACGDRSERAAAQGCTAAELAQHVVALNVGNIVTVITRPDAFTNAQWQVRAQGFWPRASDTAGADVVSTPSPRP